MGNERNLAIGDRESQIFHTIDLMHAELHNLREASAGHAIPPPRFKSGQSVLQWWAGWMKSAAVTPTSYKGNARPAWFSAEVCSYAGYKTIRYAGQETTENCYNVY